MFTGKDEEKMGEPQEDNDLFFTCSLIEYIARKTKNTKKYIVEKLGINTINKVMINKYL